jgi:pimeloyl-ACP methyl ester carboxylesterase
MTVRHHRLAAGDVDLHYVTAGDGPPIVLLHGFPETWYQWRTVIEELKSEFTLIAPDLRGVGGKPGPATGYDKRTMASDVRAITGVVCGDTQAMLAGHDIGASVALSYALRYPDVTGKLMLIDAGVPGTSFFDEVRLSPRVWHIAFHSQRDLAEALVSGREQVYLEHFIRSRLFDPGKITAEEIAVYVTAYSAPGAMRASFEWYRAFDTDAEHNRAALAAQGKVTVPVSVVGGAASVAGMLDGMADELADDWDSLLIEGTGHWISEEKPEELAVAIRALAAREPRSLTGQS